MRYICIRKYPEKKYARKISSIEPTPSDSTHTGVYKGGSWEGPGGGRDLTYQAEGLAKRRYLSTIPLNYHENPIGFTHISIP